MLWLWLWRVWNILLHYFHILTCGISCPIYIVTLCLLILLILLSITCHLILECYHLIPDMLITWLMIITFTGIQLLYLVMYNNHVSPVLLYSCTPITPVSYSCYLRDDINMYVFIMFQCCNNFDSTWVPPCISVGCTDTPVQIPSFQG